MARRKFNQFKSEFFASGIESKKKTASFEIKVDPKEMETLTLSQRLLAKAWIESQDVLWQEFKKRFN